MAINFPSSPILDQIFTSDNTSFIWNGTAWVGYSTSFVVNYNASSIVIKDDGSSVGAAGTIDFGSNLSVSFSSGVATVTGSASGSSSQFVTTAAGIHTLSNVGIGTTNPTSKLTVSGDALINGLTVGRGGGTFPENLAIGPNALFYNTTGQKNTGIGWYALQSNNGGLNNTGIGHSALFSNIGGLRNTAIGAFALSNTTGSRNTSTGNSSLLSTTIGNDNTANGDTSLYSNTTGNYNTGIGASAGYWITSGSKNTILGSYTGNQNGLDIRTSSNNVVLSDGDGNIRFYANSSGNVGLGTTNPTSALTVVGASGTTLLVTGGTIPIQIGGNGVSGTIFKVGGINLSGPDVSDVNATTYFNIRYDKVGDFRYNLEFHSGGYTGYGGAAPAGGPGDFIFYKREVSYGRAERFRISGETGDITSQGGVIATSANVSGLSTTSSLNVGTGGTIITTTTAGLVGIGTTNPTSKLTVSGDALINGITVGLGGSAVTSNTAIGSSALSSNTTGNYNTGIGFESLESNITANSNTGIGYRTLFTNRYGTQNVAIGLQSLFALDGGGYNTATGTSSLAFVVTGANNTANGFASLNETTGSNNTGIGYFSGSSITTGSKNTLLGAYTGNQNGLDIRTSSNNVVLSDGDGNIRFYANSSGNVGIGTTNPTEKLTVVGVTSSTLFYGDASYTTSGRWTLGANGAAHYTFTGIGFTQTTNDPVLYLARGRVYEFVNDSGGGHPFEIRTSNNGSAYSNGVTNNAAASGIIRFEIPFDAPNTIYYQCTNHSGMGSTIIVYPSTI